MRLKILRLNGLRLELRRAADLTPADRDEIYIFASRYIEGSRQVIDAGFEVMRDVILVRERAGGPLVGVGTMDVRLFEVAGRRRVVLYPGNALLEPRFRGRNVLQAVVMVYFLEARLGYPRCPIDLAMAVFSYKSYLLLPRTYQTFWPRYEQATPPTERELMRRVAERYSQNVRPGPGGEWIGTVPKHLRGEVAPIGSQELASAHVRYFHEQNPGYGQGDVLVVLAPLNLKNWRAMVRTTVRRQLRGLKSRARARV
ncbi:hypothetical protein DL240_15225 [Lujinxingia litoralis]|uniref:Uncharacterized protein n=1 Tax=Lujinxingia litoralis TaxID=2211119 RepID=A0A328C2K3_9DELT|nr:hypothetical protein [Lujinxingia litoralis]RAL20667.1 hypothetical protein DL240_15225 [Lujinxingia litoralis]